MNSNPYAALSQALSDFENAVRQDEQADTETEHDTYHALAEARTAVRKAADDLSLNQKEKRMRQNILLHTAGQIFRGSMPRDDELAQFDRIMQHLEEHYS